MGGVELQKIEPLSINWSHWWQGFAGGAVDPIPQFPGHQAAVTGNLNEAGEGTGMGYPSGPRELTKQWQVVQASGEKISPWP